jgi:hypothetical protein
MLEGFAAAPSDRSPPLVLYTAMVLQHSLPGVTQ